jgi:hypothetical protein
MIASVKFKKLSAPVITTVGFLQIIIGGYSDMFCTDQIRIFMAVVYDFVTAFGHHTTKFYYLLGVSTGIIFFGADSMGQAQDMKSHALNYQCMDLASKLVRIKAAAAPTGSHCLRIFYAEGGPVLVFFIINFSTLQIAATHGIHQYIYT